MRGATGYVSRESIFTSVTMASSRRFAASLSRDYAILTGQRKSGENLVGGREEEMKRLLRNPKPMEEMAFEQAMGFVPFGGVGLKVYEAVHQSKSNELIVKATFIKILATEPDPRAGKALVAAITDKEWLLRAAAFDGLARQGEELGSRMKNNR
jgi:HEAT repeat protein